MNNSVDVTLNLNRQKDLSPAYNPLVLPAFKE